MVAQNQSAVVEHGPPSQKEWLEQYRNLLSRDLALDEAISSRLSIYSLIKRVAERAGTALSHQDVALEKWYLKSKPDPPRELIEAILSNPNLLDEFFESLVPASSRKSLGQFLTPPNLADFMVSWGLINGAKSVFDPSVGTGIFLAATLTKQRDTVIRGVDVDPLMLAGCELRLTLMGGTRVGLHLSDFLAFSEENKYDFIVCNPPYLNFHDYDRDGIIRGMKARYGIQLSNLTNIYSLFFIHAAKFLKNGGVMAFITPAEFLYTGYGVELKKFLIKNFTVEAVIAVGIEELVFNGALTTAVITLLRKRRPLENHSIRFVRVAEWPGTTRMLSVLANPAIEREPCLIRDVRQDSINPAKKWLMYFEKNGGPVQLIEKLVPLSEIATVDRGIATGHNEFFTLSQVEVEKWQIEMKFLRPVITKALQSPHYDFTSQDFETLLKKGEKSYLLYCFDEPSAELRHYINQGEAQNVDKRFLTSHRTPWYSMEKKEPAPILATVFSRARMRFILNKAQARNLAAFHCIYPQFSDETMLKALLAYLNSNVCQELGMYHKRTYGGGLGKFEPRDLESLPVLDVRGIPRLDLEILANLFKELSRASRIDMSQEGAVKNKIDTVIKRILSRVGPKAISSISK